MNHIVTNMGHSTRERLKGDLWGLSLSAHTTEI